MRFAGGDGVQGRKTRGAFCKKGITSVLFYGWETSFTVYPKDLRFYVPKFHVRLSKLADIYQTAMLARGMDLFLLCHHKTLRNDIWKLFVASQFVMSLRD